MISLVVIKCPKTYQLNSPIPIFRVHLVAMFLDKNKVFEYSECLKAYGKYVKLILFVIIHICRWWYTNKIGLNNRFKQRNPVRDNLVCIAFMKETSYLPSQCKVCICHKVKSIMLFYFFITTYVMGTHWKCICESIKLLKETTAVSKFQLLWGIPLYYWLRHF